MRDRTLALVALLIVGIFVGLLAFAVIDQRQTNREIVAAFRQQAEQRKQALAEVFASLDDRDARHRHQTKADLRKIIRSIREVLRQLGGDPSTIPPQDHSSGSRTTAPNPDDDDGRPGQPRPSPSPEPSPTCLPIFEVCI